MNEKLVPGSDTEYLAEANKARQYDVELARINATKEAELARVAEERASARRTLWAGFLGAVAGFLALLSVGLIITWNVQQDRKIKERVAQTCIREGNIWQNGSCLIAHKEK